MCCRCCQRCWEDFYWNCIEERFCYDESIANYDPADDDYYKKKALNENGLLVSSRSENNNTPIVVQPSRLQRDNSHCNSKIHEDDIRAIQTNGPILAPEILAVFANSQIFHDHPSTKQESAKPSPSPPAQPAAGDTKQSFGEQKAHSDKQINDDKSDKMLIEIEGGLRGRVRAGTSQNELILNPATIDQTDAKSVEQIADDDEESTKVKLRPTKSAPYLNNLLKLERPVSDFDIFCVSDSISRIGMTPEVPSVSFSNLPKNYIDTPSVEEYKESVSLQSIQDSNLNKEDTNFDYSNPRYFQRLSSQQSMSADNVSAPKAHPPRPVEKSKRLKAIRNNLPPLRIATAKDRLSKTMSGASFKE